MPLTLMYITNSPSVAKAAEESGVQRIMVDLEYKGKEIRQRNLNTVKSNHTILDVSAVSSVLERAELMVRLNPWDFESEKEIDDVINAGADRLMLPMWKSFLEVDSFLAKVNGRVRTTLLLETKEAIDCLGKVLAHPLIEEIHIGLNDLHLSMGRTFMFELVADGTVEAICNRIREKNLPYGFGGIARMGEGALPAENVLCEHIRLGSNMVILSRAFMDSSTVNNYEEAKQILLPEINALRQKEIMFSEFSEEKLSQLHGDTIHIVDKITSEIRKR